MESILTSVKKRLGIVPEYTVFDPDIIMDINTVFGILRQMGVGPEDGFRIESDKEEWYDFTTDAAELEIVKTYMYLRVRKTFDPPTGSVLESLNESIKELEWRLFVEFN